MTRRVIFRQVDIKRAVKGAQAAGMNPSRVEVDSQGTIVLVFPNGVDYIPTTLAERSERDWAEWKAKYRGKTEQRRNKHRPQNTQ